MMHGPEKSDFAIVAVKPANKAAPTGAEQSVAGQAAAERVERRAETKGNADQQSTRRTQSRASVTQALERIRRLLAVWTRGGSRMRESRTYGSGRGARDETRVPTATTTRVSREVLLGLTGPILGWTPPGNGPGTIPSGTLSRKGAKSNTRSQASFERNEGGNTRCFVE